MRWITDEAEIAGLSEPWDEMAASSLAPTQLSHAWFCAIADCLIPPARPIVATLWSGGALRALLPLIQHKGVLRSTDATDHGPLVAPLAQNAADIELLAEGVSRRAPVMLQLPKAPVARTEVERFVEVGRGRLASIVEGEDVVYAVDMSEDSYEAHSERWISSTRRKSARRRDRKFEREHEGVTSALTVPVDVDAFLETAFALEARGWKGRAGTAIDSSPATARYYREVMRLAAARGALRVSHTYVADELVAFSLDVLEGSTLYGLKAAYDERFSSYSPGTSLELKTIEACYAQAVDRLVLGVGENPQKVELANVFEPVRSVSLYSRSPAGLTLYGGARLRRAAGSALRKSPYVRGAYRRLRERIPSPGRGR